MGRAKEVEHLEPDGGPAAVQGAGNPPVAALVSENAVLVRHQLLDGGQGLLEADGGGRTSQAKASARPLLRLHDPRPGELAEELAEVVRRGSGGGGDGLCVGEDPLLEGTEVGEGLEGMDRSLGKDRNLLSH